MRKYFGMTMIEIMITLALVAILATVASVLYTRQAQKGRRIDAFDAILTLTLAEEQYRSKHVRYGTLSELGISASSPEGYYVLSVSLVGKGYVITAEATGPQLGDKEGNAVCTSLQYSMNQGAITRTPNECWPK